MNPASDNKAFVFNELINSQYLNDLYGDDLQYIEEVFGTVLNEYETMAEQIFTSFSSKDITSLKKAVHKIKPIFGFVGLLSIQEQCQEFEKSCDQNSSIDCLSKDFIPLKNNIIKGKLLIEEEKGKLALFNS